MTLQLRTMTVHVSVELLTGDIQTYFIILFIIFLSLCTYVFIYYISFVGFVLTFPKCQLGHPGPLHPGCTAPVKHVLPQMAPLPPCYSCSQQQRTQDPHKKQTVYKQVRVESQWQ